METPSWIVRTLQNMTRKMKLSGRLPLKHEHGISRLRIQRSSYSQACHLDRSSPEAFCGTKAFISFLSLNGMPTSLSQSLNRGSTLWTMKVGLLGNKSWALKLEAKFQSNFKFNTLIMLTLLLYS